MHLFTDISFSSADLQGKNILMISSLSYYLQHLAQSFEFIINSQNQVAGMEINRQWQEGAMRDAPSGFCFCSLVCARPLGVPSGAIFPSHCTLSWHKRMCDQNSHCHNKRINLYPLFQVHVITGRILLDVSLAFKTQRAQTEILISSPTGFSSHILFQFVSPSSSLMFYSETWRTSLIPPLSHPPCSINHLVYDFIF